MNGDDVRALIVAGLIAAIVVVFATAAHADEPKLPSGYTCDDVRRAVAEHGRAGALALALWHGATRPQIKAARACLSAR